jgi:GTP cyclohydrolase I
MENTIRKIFEHIGENPEREGLIDTPKRIIKMWKELFHGYDKGQLPKVTTFKNGKDNIYYDQMIIDSGDYYSFCEHHMLPFFGKYWFAYIPSKKGEILGLSKVARVVDYFSAKMQIQERLVDEIVNYLWKCINKKNPPVGMALMMEGQHLCKTMRGVKKEGSMITSKLKGEFLKNDVKMEFFNLIK